MASQWIVFPLLVFICGTVGCAPKNASQFRQDLAAQQRVDAAKGGTLGAALATIGFLLPIPGGTLMGAGIGAALGGAKGAAAGADNAVSAAQADLQHQQLQVETERLKLELEREKRELERERRALEVEE